MHHTGNGFLLWRRYHVSRWTVAVGLVALLVTSLAAGVYITRATTPNGPIHTKAAWPKQPSVKDEGAWFQLSHFGNKLPPANARQLALQQAAKLPVSHLGSSSRQANTANGAPLSTLPGQWQGLGPQPIDFGGGSFDSGRITALVVNPNNGNDIWAGAADGGLWHSINGGLTWSPATDDQPTLSIGSIAIDTHSGSPYTIYAGTGEGNLNGDAYWGDGVLKSTDGGASWTLYNPSQLAGLSIPRIAVDPFNSNNLYLAANYSTVATSVTGFQTSQFVGMYQSIDGGQHWTRMTLGGQNAPGTDVVFDPTRNGVAYAAVGSIGSCNPSPCVGGVYETTDHGVNWTLMTGTNAPPSGTSTLRPTIGLSANGNTLYAAISNQAGDLLNGDIYAGSFNTTLSTWSWAANPVPAAMACDQSIAPSCGDQWWYDIYTMVDPTVSAGTTLYVGGIDVWQSTDGGVSWNNLTNAYGGSTGVHPDQHALAFLPGKSAYYFGNDGGVWNGTVGGGSFNDLNGGGLNITQFYGGSIGENGPDAQLYGGAQDNGETQYPAGPVGSAATWTEVFGGDGGDTAVDYTNNANVYEEYVGLSLNKSTNGGATWFAATTGISAGDPVNFIAPFVMSQSNPNMLVAGTDRVYRTTNGATSWSAISSPLDGTTPLSALAIAASNNSVIYAGDNNGHIYVTTNGGGSWSGGAISPFAPGMITSLAVDPTNSSVAYASVNGFVPIGSSGGYHVFKTTNAGGVWTDISGSLPDIPFESVTVDPANHNLVVAGSDAGVFESSDAGATWAVLGVGLPNAAINQIFFDHTGGSLFVATHGRGMWELFIPDIATTPTSLIESTPVNTNAPAQTVKITNTGVGTLNWAANNLPSWVSNVSPSTGALAGGASQNVTITYNTSGVSTSQTLTGSITLSDPNAGNSPYSLPVTVVVENIAKTWYFAEGHTGDSFTEYLTLENPNSSTTSVQVQYLLGGGHSPITKSYSVGANSRATITVNNEVGAPQDVSMVVTGSQPIVAERPIYFTYNGLPGYAIPGGSDVLGATALNSSFDFGYLDTSTAHDTWLTILNQNSQAMDAHVSYYPAAGGAPITKLHTVAANSRGTIHVNSEGLPAGSYSAIVSLTQNGNSTALQGLVERPLYLVDSVTGYTGSADVVGVATPLSAWYFAEGYTGPTFSERYILSNPGSTSVSASITFLKAGGVTVNAGPYTLAAGQQQVVDAISVLGGSVNNSAVVTSTGGPILAERFMSFAYTGPVGSGGSGVSGGVQGASDVLGAAAPAQLYEFAEGYSGGQFAEYLTLENPNATAAHVTVRYLPQSGGAPLVLTYVVPAKSRYTIFTNTVLANQSFSMEVLADQPVVAERPMYFSFDVGNGPQNGGSDVLGYAP